MSGEQQGEEEGKNDIVQSQGLLTLYQAEIKIYSQDEACGLAEALEIFKGLIKKTG